MFEIAFDYGADTVPPSKRNPRFFKCAVIPFSGRDQRERRPGPLPWLCHFFRQL